MLYILMKSETFIINSNSKASQCSYDLIKTKYQSSWRNKYGRLGLPQNSDRMGHGRNLRRNYINEELPEICNNQVIARVTQVRDKGVVGIERRNEEELLVSELAFLPPRFR